MFLLLHLQIRPLFLLNERSSHPRWHSALERRQRVAETQMTFSVRCLLSSWLPPSRLSSAGPLQLVWLDSLHLSSRFNRHPIPSRPPPPHHPKFLGYSNSLPSLASTAPCPSAPIPSSHPYPLTSSAISWVYLRSVKIREDLPSSQHTSSGRSDLWIPSLEPCARQLVLATWQRLGFLSALGSGFGYGVRNERW